MLEERENFLPILSTDNYITKSLSCEDTIK